MKMKKRNRVSKNRIRLLELGSVVVSLLIGIVFANKYLLSPLYSASARATKNAVTYEAIEGYMVEGDIVDRNGQIILGYGDVGTAATAPAPYNYSYSWLLGYYSLNGEKENAFGLRGNLKDYSLFHLDKENKGATAVLTTDSGLQDYAYNLIGNDEGSISVIDNETGAILCLASHSTIDFDANDVESLLTSDVEGSQYRRGTYENDPPGSTYKVITSAAALLKAEEEGLGDDFFYYHDDGEYNPAGSEFIITNWDDRVYGDLNLETALNSSVNCYFADLGIRVGKERLEQMSKNFLIGSDIDVPFLDTLHSSLDFGSGDAGDIAQASFGQGNIGVTPLHLTLIAQAIANDGVMMAPYIVKEISQDDRVLYHHDPKKLKKCIDASLADQLKPIMHSTAETYGLYEGYYGYVCAKTGTAECINDRIHTYLMGFTDRYSFCISFNNSDISHSLYPIAQNLVNYLNLMS